MSWAITQSRLNDLGYHLSVDGIPGPHTFGALFAFLGAKDTASQFGAAAADYWPPYEITTPLRVCHFLAQASAETGAFRYMTELWGPTDAQVNYEGNAALGNTQPGDGYKYRGRGLLMLTGRANYQRFAGLTGLNLVTIPDLASQPVPAVNIATLYWSKLDLNHYADANDLLAVSNGINRGNPASLKTPNGYDLRKAAFAKAAQVLL